MFFKYFSDWKIGTKLYFNIGIILLLLVTLGLLSLQQISSINQTAKNMYTLELLPLKGIDNLASIALTIKNKAAQHILDPSERRQIEASLKKDFTTIESIINNSPEWEMSTEESSLIQQVQEKLDNYKKLLFGKVLALSSQNEVDTAEEFLLGEGDKTLKDALSSISKLSKLQVQSAEDEFVTAQEDYNEMRVLVITIISIALSISLILSWKVIRSIRIPLFEVRDALKKLQQGDLTQSVTYHSEDELGQMANDLNIAISSQREMIEKVTSTIDQLAAASEEMSAVTNQTKQTVSEQKTETSEVAAAMGEMTAAIRDVANSIAHTADAASRAKEETKEGADIVRQALDQINDLATQIDVSSETITKVDRHSEEITAVLEVIRGIAEQTNLLALNAAIEAARAGEQGRGFAVVADEVRTLAGRTQESTQEINDMIEKLQIGSRHAVEVMEQSRTKSKSAVDFATQSGQSLKSISEAVQKINDMSSQIASAAEEQRAVSEEINSNILRINKMSEETSTGAEETDIASRDLSRMASELQSLTLMFKI